MVKVRELGHGPCEHGIYYTFSLDDDPSCCCVVTMSFEAQAVHILQKYVCIELSLDLASEKGTRFDYDFGLTIQELTAGMLQNYPTISIGLKKRSSRARSFHQRQQSE